MARWRACPWLWLGGSSKPLAQPTTGERPPRRCGAAPSRCAHHGLLTARGDALGRLLSLVVALRLAQVVKKRLEPGDGPLVAFCLATPSAFGGIVGELALKAEAFAEPRRVLGSGDEFSACQVKVALADLFAVEWIDDREAYDEERFNLLGICEGALLHVTYTERGELIWIISVRRAERHEQDHYFRENSV